MESSRGIKEVIWDGKYERDGKLQRPEASEIFSRAYPLYEMILRHVNPQGAGLFRGDNLAVMALLYNSRRRNHEPLIGAEPVKLIYIDPPFDIDRELVGRFEIAGKKVEIPCYDDRWGEDRRSFAFFMWERLIAMHALLDEKGSIFVHTNDHSAPLLRALLDDVFGAERFVNQIIWHYTGGGRARKRLSNKHDVILWYSKSKDFTFNGDAIRVPYKESSGYAKGGITAASGKHYTPHPDGTIPSDVWEIPIVNPMAEERTGYPTQKPIALLERIIKLASNEGDTVADFFCGSASFLEAATALNRSVIGADASPVAFVQGLSRIGKCVHNYSAWVEKAKLGCEEELYMEGEAEDGAFRINYIKANVEEDPALHIALISINNANDGEFEWEQRHFEIGDRLPIRVESGSLADHSLMLNAFNYRGEYFRGALMVKDGQIRLKRIL